MKRLWLGAGILAALLVACLAVTWGMDRIHDPISRDLEQAGRAAMEEDWEVAEAHADSARARWEKYWEATAAAADHGPMDDMDRLFAQLPVYAGKREAVHFAACCAELSRLAEAMGEAHSLGWWDFL